MVFCMLFTSCATFYSLSNSGCLKEQQISIKMTFLSNSCAGYEDTKTVTEHSATASVKLIGIKGGGDNARSLTGQ